MCLPRKIAFHTRRICTCHAKLRWRSPKCCVCHKKCNSSSETDAKVLRLPQNDDRHVCRHMRMTGSATPATQNHITTCFDTLDQDRFCSFPHRHGEATENQRLETRHVGASKQAFHARLSPILTLCSFKIDVFLRLIFRT